jgi:hypothetical protein
MSLDRTKELLTLPENLPVPEDDGSCKHLVPGLKLNIDSTLTSSSNRSISPSELSQGLVVLYIFPKIGRPDRDPPQGWNEIPGARGCTPQSCSFRDHHAELQVRNFFFQRRKFFRFFEIGIFVETWSSSIWPLITAY